MWLAKADFSLAAGSLLQPPALPNQAELKANIDNGINQLQENNGLPDFRYQLAMQRLADNQLQLAQANGRSDITVNAGIRQLEATGDQAFSVGFSMPLAFENPNRGRIARAQIAQELSLQQTDIKRQQLALALEVIQQQLTANLEHVEHIENQQMPLARQLLQSSQSAYTRGQYSVLQWIDAQQQFFGLQLRLVDTRLTVLNQILELERVLGRPIVSSPALSETAGVSEKTSTQVKNKI
jgi:cobalt-zinc-cadmium efflux system outer membrane protein